MPAGSGFCKQFHHPLAKIKMRPKRILIFCGLNEFKITLQTFKLCTF